MKNQHGLSKYNMTWLANDDYDHNEGFVSATSLLKSTRTVLLNRFVKNNDNEEATSKLAIQTGTAMHNYREHVPYPECFLREERMFMSLEKFGITSFGISGKPDLIDYDYNQPQVVSSSGLLVMEDLKVSSIWGLKNPHYEDYTKQLSILRYLALVDPDVGFQMAVRGIKQDVKSFSNTGVITYIPRDWNKSHTNIVPVGIKEIPLQLMSIGQTEKFIKMRVKEIAPYWGSTNQDDYPICSDEYRNKFGKKMCSMYCPARFICRYSGV